ncbi:hypothetical protein B0T10DRAFT_76972, partial [Thelonectria olida]
MHDILESLSFGGMVDRYKAIPQAHTSTFRWIFEAPDIPFVPWLKTGNEIFWLNGKMGSGKSTLMKYIAHHPRTEAALRTWAGPKKLVTASYYFWSDARQGQKSHEGMLRRIIAQVLTRLPDLIEPVKPVWGRVHQTKEPWNLEDLTRALDAIIEYSLSSTTFCFFIDGLDANGGHFNVLLDSLSRLALNTTVKICTSSRPINQIEDHFQHCPTIKLQDFTRPDMERYAADSLTFLIEHDPKNATLIISQIVERAQGIFYYAYLAVQEVIRRMENGNPSFYLQRRLDVFLPDLMPMFERAMHQIAPVYRASAACYLQIQLASIRPLPVEIFEAAERHLQEPDFVLHMQISLDIEQWKKEPRRKTIERRINSHGGGLLEVQTDDSDIVFPKKVAFVHASARDFLANANQLYLWAPSIHAEELICHSLLALIKQLPGTRPEILEKTLAHLTRDILLYAQECGRREGKLDTRILDELDRVNTLLDTAHAVFHWTNNTIPVESFEYGHKTFLALAIEYRLVPFVEKVANTKPDLFNIKQGRPYLDYVLRPSEAVLGRVPTDMYPIDITLLGLLLGLRLDPNEKFHDGTVWGAFLRLCLPRTTTTPGLAKQCKWDDAIKLLLIAGADQDITLVFNGKGMGFHQIFRAILGEDYSPKLLQDMERIREERSRPSGSSRSRWKRLTTYLGGRDKS